jgi:ATP-dependent DNA helicase RecG
MALRRCFPMMRIDYIRVPGRKWVENPELNYLSPMVAEGILAYTIPEMENHPDQRYTTVNQE